MSLLSIEQSIWLHASSTPDKVALKSGRNCASYAQLWHAILSAKAYFEKATFYESKRAIILAAGKQLGFVYAYFGAHLAGLRVVPIDPETNPTRFDYIVHTLQPLCVIGFEKHESPLPYVSLKTFEELENCQFSDFQEFPQPDNIADILFTTGTTGVPKGVPLTFANESAAARNINEYIGNGSEDVELLALPVSHSFGLGRLRCCLSVGATLILHGSFVNVKRLFRLMREEHVTGFTMVPASWKFLQKMSGEQLVEYADQLRYIEMGSAYLGEEDKRLLASLFPHTRVTMHYGLTEASRSAFMEFHEDADHLSSVGKASPHCEIAIFDEGGHMLPSNTEGEIGVKGDHVTHGYINVPNADIFFGSYFRTGDWGTKDDEGYVYLKSRKKELINVGGKKVSPLEVEEQLLKVPGIADCACTAQPDPNGVLGEVVKAFIVPSPEATITFEQIAEHLKGTLESYKLPALYEWAESIPRTQNGKILRGQLP